MHLQNIGRWCFVTKLLFLIATLCLMLAAGLFGLYLYTGEVYFAARGALMTYAGFTVYGVVFLLIVTEEG